MGDNPFDDVLGAHGVGMGTVWVNRTGQEYDTTYPEPDHADPKISHNRAFARYAPRTASRKMAGCMHL